MKSIAARTARLRSSVGRSPKLPCKLTIRRDDGTHFERNPVADRYRKENRIEFVVAVGAPAGHAQEQIDLGGCDCADQFDHGCRTAMMRA